jgi:lysophospholipase L1-like esterase
MLSHGTKLLMIGDSITDCGRERPVGGPAIETLGSGYVSLVAAGLVARRPELRVEVLNTGIGGDTVRDLDRRWQADVLDLAPGVLTCMIGINDVWRKFGQPEDHVPVGEFQATLAKLLEAVRPSLAGMVLLTPFLVETDEADEFLALTREYGVAAKRVADQLDAVVFDTQAAFDGALRHYPASALAGDRVHPTLAGHMILAEGVLRLLGAGS